MYLILGEAHVEQADAPGDGVVDTAQLNPEELQRVPARLMELQLWDLVEQFMAEHPVEDDGSGSDHDDRDDHDSGDHDEDGYRSGDYDDEAGLGAVREDRPGGRRVPDDPRRDPARVRREQGLRQRAVHAAERGDGGGLLRHRAGGRAAERPVHMGLDDCENFVRGMERMLKG